MFKKISSYDFVASQCRQIYSIVELQQGKYIFDAINQMSGSFHSIQRLLKLCFFQKIFGEDQIKVLKICFNFPFKRGSGWAIRYTINAQVDGYKIKTFARLIGFFGFVGLAFLALSKFLYIGLGGQDTSAQTFIKFTFNSKTVY